MEIFDNSALSYDDDYNSTIFGAGGFNGSDDTPCGSAGIGSRYCFDVTIVSVAAQCLSDGALLKSPDSFKVYVIINCQKKWIKTAEEFELAGHEWSEIQEVSSSIIEDYSDYSLLETTPTLLKAVGEYKVYRIISSGNGLVKRLWIPTAAAFNAQGLVWDDIYETSIFAISQFPRAKLLRIAGGYKVYYITEAGYKRHIPSPQAFLSYGNKWEDIIDVEFEVVNSFPDNSLIRVAGDYKVYKLENGQKRWIKNAGAFNAAGLDWNNIAPVNVVELDAYPDGVPIE